MRSPAGRASPRHLRDSGWAGPSILGVVKRNIVGFRSFWASYIRTRLNGALTGLTDRRNSLLRHPNFHLPTPYLFDGEAPFSSLRRHFGAPTRHQNTRPYVETFCNLLYLGGGLGWVEKVESMVCDGGDIRET